jgi:hypothetical protein
MKVLTSIVFTEDPWNSEKVSGEKVDGIRTGLHAYCWTSTYTFWEIAYNSDPEFERTPVNLTKT